MDNTQQFVIEGSSAGRDNDWKKLDSCSYTTVLETN